MPTAEESYRGFMCRLVYPGCDFTAGAKTDDEGHSGLHAASVNGSRIDRLFLDLKVAPIEELG